MSVPGTEALEPYLLPRQLSAWQGLLRDPIDWAPILASVEKTGRAVVAHEASGFLGLGAEIAATITERAFYSLEAPVLRVGGFAVPYPAARIEEHYLPDVDRVLDAVDRSLAF